MVRRFHPALELLEDRVLLTDDYWTGQGNNNFWSNAANWDGRVPRLGDSVYLNGDPPAGRPAVSVDNIAGLAITDLQMGSNWGGTLTLNQPLTVDGQFALQKGTVNGGADLTLSGRIGGRAIGAGGYWWAGSTIGGSGRLVVQANAEFTINNPLLGPQPALAHTLSGRNLVIQRSGKVTWIASPIALQNDAEIQDTGLFDVDGNISMNITGNGFFSVERGGAYRQWDSSSTVTISAGFWDNQGGVQLGEGTFVDILSLKGGGRVVGLGGNRIDFAINTGSEVDIASPGSTFRILGETLFIGGGRLEMSSNIRVQRQGAGQPKTKWEIEVRQVLFQSGTIYNETEIDVSGTSFQWAPNSGGMNTAMIAGPGTVDMNANVTLAQGDNAGPNSIASLALIGGVFINRKDFYMPGVRLWTLGREVFNNIGGFWVYDGSSVQDYTGSARFMNYGSFGKIGGGTARVTTTFVNLFGRVLQNGGTTKFSSFTQFGGQTHVVGGLLLASAGLNQLGGDVDVAASGSLSVAGTYALGGGTATIEGNSSMTAGTFTQTGGTASIGGQASITTANIESGTFHALQTALVSLGSYTESPTDPLEIDLDSTSALIDVSGAIDLAGGLVLNPISGFSAGTSTITLISNTGSNPVAGVFSGLDEGTSAVTVGTVAERIFYNGNSDGRDVVLEPSNPFSNTPPVANADLASTHGAAITINVLANDYDPDGDALTVTSVGTPAHGSAVINGNNTITYTPANGTTASSDSFTYTISDGHGGSSSATVTVQLVDTPPVANYLTVTQVSAAVTVNPLANDYDADGDSLTITAVGTPASGSATINSGATITYAPASGETAQTDAFSYTISDGHGGTSTATINVLFANAPPIALDASADTGTAAVTVNVLANDSDPEGYSLTVTAVGTPLHGSAVINGNNTVTYTPATGTTASTDAFSYTVSDGHGATSSATVTIYLANQPPVAVDTTVAHATAAVTVNVLTDDTDPDGDALTVSAVGTPAHGTAAIVGNGNVTYTPTSGTTAATDLFTYTISDGHGGTSSASVFVYLADRVPVALDAIVYHGTAAVTATVVPNDSDPDGDTLTVTSAGTPAHGTAQINGDNSITYTPTSGTTAATDRFTYAVSDGHGGTSSATVTVYLADQPPVAVDVSASTHSAAVSINVLANDTDAAGDALTVTAVGTPAHGTAVISGGGTAVTYTPTTGTTAATDAFSYTISDGHGGTSTATVDVYLTELSPVAVNVSASTHSAAVTVAVLANDADPDGDYLTVTAVGTPAHGTAVINAGQTVTYTPTAGTTAATDAFTYTISDGHGATSTATVDIYLAEQAIQAVNVSASTHAAPVTIAVLTNDSDPDGDALTLTAVATPAHGTAAINAGNTVLYTPASGTTAGTDSFAYTISDGHGATATATAVVYLADRPPVAQNVTAPAYGVAATISVLANDSDPDADPLTVTAIGTPAHGTAVLNADNTVTYTPTSGTTYATDSFTYTVSDGYGGSSTATVVMYLADRPPIAVGTTAVAHSAAVTVAAVANDSSPDGEKLTLTAVGSPAHGTTVLNADNTVTYTPTTGTTAATDSFTYTVSDGYGGTSIGTVVVYLSDRPPVAAAASASTHSAAVTINVLANDSSPDGDNLTVTAVGTPAHGTAVINADNTVTYTPTTGTTAATDSFTYSISDGYGGTSTGTVYVYLADQPPVATNASASTHSAAVIIPVLANDSDPDGDTLTVTAVGTASHGTAVINADNTVTYTPTSGTTAATDGFTYTVGDGHGGTSTANVVIYLIDRAPLAVNTSASTHSAAVTISVLANDSSPDGDNLTVTAVGTPAHGTAIINADNSVTYTPTTGTTAGTDAFTYTIADGYGGTSTATVVIYLPDRPPVANNTSATTHSVAVTVAVLANDSDPDGDNLTVTAVGTPAHGRAVINADNTITFTPTSGTTAATDSFTYTIADGYGGTSTGTVVIYLTDRPPVANNDSASTHSAAITLAVLANASDPDGDSLNVTSVGTPTHGTAVINADNTVTYTPTSGTTAATDAFTYTISDGYGGTSTATAYIYLKDTPPVATNDTASAHSAAVKISVLPADYDPDGDTLTVTAIGTPSSGTAVLNADNTVTYTPNAGTTATTDQFTYSIADGHGGTSTATVFVFMGGRDIVAVDDSAVAHSAAVTINVLANDSDFDGDALTVTSVSPASYGTTILNADNTVTYIPNAGTTATTDTFTYTASEGDNDVGEAWVTVHLVDRPPHANNTYVSTRSAAVTVAVLGNASSPDGDTLTVTAVGTPANGTAVRNADNTVTYTPNAGTTASTDSFTYTIADGYGGTSSATVYVQLADQAPVALGVSASTHSTAVTIAVLASDGDPDGDPLTVTAVGTPSSGMAVLNADNTVTYTPNSGTTASTDHFTYTVSDGHGGTSTATVTVQLADQAPIAVNVTAPTLTAAVTVAVLAGDSDPDGDPLTVTAIGTPANGTAVLNADNTVTYTPNAGTTATTDAFSYTISDGHGGTSTATVTVQLTSQPPVAEPVTVATGGQKVLLDLLADASDPEGYALTVTSIGTPTNGNATLYADGTVVYSPSANPPALDTFTYTVSDGHGGTSTGTITVTITTNPIAVNEQASALTALPVTISPLSDDVDTYGDALTITALGTASHGTAYINANGTITYVRTPGTMATSDTFTYTISDGHGGTSTATITISLV